MLTAPDGTVAFRFRPPHTHVVLSSDRPEPIPFRVLLDDEAPGPSHGADVNEAGNGLLAEGRLYQLVRQHDVIARTLRITFQDAGAEAYAFTFFVPVDRPVDHLVDGPDDCRVIDQAVGSGVGSGSTPMARRLSGDQPASSP